jgi:hypothetical protein
MRRYRTWLGQLTCYCSKCAVVRELTPTSYLMGRSIPVELEKGI